MLSNVDVVCCFALKVRMAYFLVSVLYWKGHRCRIDGEMGSDALGFLVV